jgi:hypothetical protein
MNILKSDSGEFGVKTTFEGNEIIKTFKTEKKAKEFRINEIILHFNKLERELEIIWGSIGIHAGGDLISLMHKLDKEYRTLKNTKKGLL